MQWVETEGLVGLEADPGDTVRFWVVAAGPSLDTAFHVVGTILDRAWVDADMTQYLRGVQTVNVPAGGGAVFDVKIDEPGLYPFLSHSFASVDLGQVGEIESIDPRVIETLEAGGFIPVVAPIGVGEDGRSYNINADLVAGKLAVVLQAEKLILLTNTPGVLDAGGKLLTGVTPREIDAMVADGTLSGGMLPKIGSALDAARSGVNSVHIIDGRVPHALLLEVLTDQGVGTLIRGK